MREIGKLEWFGGNQDALNMYRMFVDLSHAWDDIVDGDKKIGEIRINNAFITALVYLPSNHFYRSIQDQILPMWLMIVSAYEVANKFEKDKEFLPDMWKNIYFERFDEYRKEHLLELLT